MSDYLYSTVANRPRWGANQPGGEQARGRTGKGTKKSDTVCEHIELC